MRKDSAARTLLLGDQPPRADAERNVDALLAATHAFVLAGNLDPSAAQIAARAGVGVGTLYRRAPRKETLLAAVVVDLLDDVSARATLVADGSADAWGQFRTFALAYLEIRQITCRISHALEEEFNGAVGAAMARTREAFSAMTARLHDRGAIDSTLTAEELMVMLASIDPVDATLGLRPDTQRQQAATRRIIDSLRPHASSQ
ncbi:TetR/AcrR family transcriptional regulator [Branchiibius sp. NY16-3462-2]|uniref:TetR/AcrR family transcriptional regulator n=1 Tax=Branchiibius sp. NY16-3462-2 TaxID=1807500 RepID=UPI0007981088|nr:TetR/AcrR family transcriptional regulator [Branchiibius sp. NY16-3462-2]KYH45580.1 TetR family transcriptional regulator [Branchiibius sp. NY16-3462-2]